MDLVEAQPRRHWYDPCACSPAIITFDSTMYVSSYAIRFSCPATFASSVTHLPRKATS
jgi:hypothetical protein